MSTTAKVLWVLGGIFAVGLVVCCGGVGLVGYWGYNVASKALSEDPAEIERVTGGIVVITIPPGFEPRVSFDFQVPFQAGFLQSVVYHDPACNGTLSMVQHSDDANPRADQQQRLNHDMNRRLGIEPLDIVVDKTELFETEIHDQPAKFSIGQGDARGTDKRYWKVTGDFRGAQGPAKFVFEANVDAFSREQLLELLRSMH